MYSGNQEYRQRLSQVERIVGELNALKVMYYEPSAGHKDPDYIKAQEVIASIEIKLRNNFC